MPKDGSDISKKEVGLNRVCCWKSINITAFPKLTGKKIQHSSTALSGIKYNCAVLFLRQMYWLFMYASKHIFSPRLKNQTCENFLISLKKTEFTELPTGRDLSEYCQIRNSDCLI